MTAPRLSPAQVAALRAAADGKLARKRSLGTGMDYRIDGQRRVVRYATILALRDRSLVVYRHVDSWTTAVDITDDGRTYLATLDGAS